MVAADSVTAMLVHIEPGEIIAIIVIVTNTHPKIAHSVIIVVETKYLGRYSANA